MSINHRIFLLVMATSVIVAWPLLYISEEMYQEQITIIVDRTSKETVQQTLLFMKDSPASGQFLNTEPVPGKQIFAFDAKGKILEGDNSAEAHALVDQLRKQILPQWRGPAILNTEVAIDGENPKGWDCTVGFSRGLGIYVAVCYDRDYTYDVSTSMKTTAGILTLTVLVLGLIGAKFISTRITRPLKQLTNYARQLPSRDITDGKTRNALSELKSTKDKDVGELVRSFAHMEKELARLIQNERNTAAERERIQSELRIAAEIQQGALPKNLHIPNEAASIKAHMIPAREIGGDLYDYFMVNAHTLIFSLGDVSGKGVPAALFMFATQHALRSLAMQDMPLNTVMEKLNNTLAANNTSAMYVTIVVGRYDLRTKELQYVFAGHQPPFLKRAGQTIKPLEGSANLPVGNISDIEFETHKIQLAIEDRLIIFTDGITEACDDQGTLYGIERLASLLQKNEENSCENLLETLFSSVTDFSQGCEMHDDITALCFHAKGNSNTSNKAEE